MREDEGTLKETDTQREWVRRGLYFAVGGCGSIIVHFRCCVWRRGASAQKLEGATAQHPSYRPCAVRLRRRARAAAKLNILH